MQFGGVISIFIFCHIIFNIPVGNAQVIQDKEVQKSIVDIHNEARRSVDPTVANMREMKWSDCLAEATYESFDDGCLTGGNIQAIAAAKNCEASDQEVGLNFFVSLQPITDVSTPVMDWANQRSGYIPESNQCVEGQQCVNYILMIYPESFLVGCAIFDNPECSNKELLCSYSKGGALYGQPYALGEKCSECISPWDNCNDGLCARNDGNSLFPSKTSSIIIFAIVFIFML